MGTYNKGILGAFSGKVGPVVGASWRGRDVLRSLPRKTKREPTEAQLMQRLKFATIMAFLSPLHPITGRYYGGDTGGQTRKNQAMSYHIREAVAYTAPNFEIIYNKVQISKGDLLGIQAPVMAAAAGTSIDFTWIDNAGQGDAVATDNLVIAVYEPTTKTTVYALSAGTRASASANLIVPAYLSGLAVHVWVTFASADEKKYATSMYMGDLVLS